MAGADRITDPVKYPSLKAPPLGHCSEKCIYNFAPFDLEWVNATFGNQDKYPVPLRKRFLM